MKRRGAIAKYKAAVRKIKRDRAKGVEPSAHLASGRPVALRDGANQWRVFSAPQPGPPFVPAKQIAGPFDTRDEAQGWIDEN